MRGNLVGTLVGVAEGRLLVSVEGIASAVSARCTLALDAGELATALARKAPVLLVFERDDPALPIVTGFLHELPAQASAPSAAPGPALPLEAKLDGKRVVLDAEDEIVLRCGAASITLRRNGRVIIRGTYLESRSRGINRIKGGAVQIN
jgi:hypothetical protein